MIRFGAAWLMAILAAGAVWPAQTGAPEPASVQEQAPQPAQTEEAGETLDPAEREVPDYDTLVGEEKALELPGQRSLTGLLLNAVGSLLLVIGLILLLAFLAKRFLPKNLIGAGQGGDRLRLIQSLPVGQRRFVSLIEADGKRFLVGVADAQITLIKSMDDVSFDEELKQVDQPKTVREWEEEQG